ncbi:MAG: ATP-binding protein [Firmicutes bacterium]|nr:ATP-binding protein [Bacillota bacterium]
MKFIGRTEELKKLEKQIETDELSFSLIYGRRRIGKSELVKQVLRNTDGKSIYFECKQVAEENNVKSLAQVVSDVLSLPMLGYTDMESLLDYIFKLAGEEKLILVLDEYPYLRASVKGMDSILQSLVGKYRESSKLKLIILGSYVEIMKSLLEHSNPLYGRIDLVIDLRQMDYYESAMFYPGYSSEDRVRIYSVFGGIPYYNRLIDDKKSVRENIIDLIASPGARLENEISGYLNAEISKIINANEVFEALAAGHSKYSDILSHSHVSSGPTLADVLDKLIKMEVVEKTAPINDLFNKKRMGYRIADNLSLFYYRYVFKYSSQLRIMDPEVFYEKYIEKDFEEQFVPRQFEEICKQFLIRENKVGRIEPVIEKIGKYYYDNPKDHTNGEFDIVTEDEEGYVFYEVKFRRSPITKAMVEEEIAQVEKTGLACYKYVFFSRSGFEEMSIENVVKVDIKSLFP